MNMPNENQGEYSVDRFHSDIRLVIEHIVDALRKNPQYDDYPVELCIFANTDPGEHEGPTAVVKMPNGLPPEKRVWPQIFSVLGRQYGSSGAPKATAVVLATHAYVREIPVEKPAAGAPEVDPFDLLSSVSDWLNAGAPEVEDASADKVAEEEKRAREDALKKFEALTEEEYEALPRTEVITIMATTVDGIEGSAVIHFTRDESGKMVPEDADEVLIGTMETRRESWGDNLLSTFFKTTAGRSGGFKSSIDPFK